MHKNPLIQFIQDKVNETPVESKTGPVITISRDFGCPGDRLGHHIAEVLEARNKSGKEPWKTLGKEIIYEAAQEINMSAELVEKITNKKEHSIFTDLFSAFSDHYTPNDLEVKRVVAGVIRAMALKGHVILIGRGSVALTQDIKDSINIHLYASTKWRVARTMERFSLKSEEEARKKLEQIDFERTYLRNFYAGRTIDQSYYDVTFNAETFSIEDMAESVMAVMERRGYI